MFDAALEGVGPYAKYAYFFVGQSYLAYDWTAGADRGGRVVDHGPRPMSEWDLPVPFNSGVTGALNGAGPYAGKAYFFRDARYVEYDWATGHGSGPYPMSAWPLPGPYLTGFDDAWSGEAAAPPTGTSCVSSTTSATAGRATPSARAIPNPSPNAGSKASSGAWTPASTGTSATGGRPTSSSVTTTPG